MIECVWLFVPFLVPTLLDRPLLSLSIEITYLEVRSGWGNTSPLSWILSAKKYNSLGISATISAAKPT